MALPRWCALNMPHMLRRQPGWFLSSYSPVKGDERPVLAEMACAASGEAASVPAAASCERKARRPWGAPICKADELPTASTQITRASMSESGAGSGSLLGRGLFCGRLVIRPACMCMAARTVQ